MNSEAAYQYAWDHAERNPDGSRVEASVVELIAANIDFDADKYKQGLAQRILGRRRRPGQTAPDGVVVFPGMEHYAYEPDRLVADDKGNLIRNADAKPDYKIAESERAQQDLEKAMERQSREKREADQISRWAVRELTAGRPDTEVTWDACVRETGLWKDVDPEPDDADTAEDTSA